MASSGTSKCEGQLCKSHADQGSGVSLPTSPSLWSPFRGDDLHSPVVTIELRTTWQVMDGDDQEQRQTHLRYRRQPRPHGSGLIDRLHELGANEQLKLLTARLQKLVVRATAGDDDQGTKAAQRQARRPKILRGNPRS